MKSSLRKQLKDKLGRLSVQDIQDKSLAISQKLESFLQDSFVSDQKILGAYAPIQQEPLWYLALEREWPAQIILSLPTVQGKRAMSFYPTSLDKLKQVTDVLAQEERAATHIVAAQMLLIPGLAFSLKGARLGRGGGYYDRYLEQNDCYKIGLCYECQLIKEWKVEEHDIRMNMIITEKAIYNIGDN